ncbi:hypothetical protein ACWGNE_21395 [Streptomyces xiamenensis]
MKVWKSLGLLAVQLDVVGDLFGSNDDEVGLGGDVAAGGFAEVEMGVGFGVGVGSPEVRLLCLRAISWRARAKWFLATVISSRWN